MKKEMQAYMQAADKLIEEQNPKLAWDEICTEHLVHIQFFQHERLIHLLVTMVFALLTFASVWILHFSFSIPACLLTLLLFCLLVPYIRHYYFLENGVQKMYRQHDRMIQIRDSFKTLKH